VKHFTILAIQDGKWVLPDSEESLALLGDSDPDYDAVAFAVRNLGFIKLQILPESIMEIEVHPRNVGARAVQAVQEQLLLTSQIKLFVIKYLDQRWRSEISPSVEHTIKRLSELCTSPSVGSLRQQKSALSFSAPSSRTYM
jgi:hypothetical protein